MQVAEKSDKNNQGGKVIQLRYLEPALAEDYRDCARAGLPDYGSQVAFAFREASLASFSKNCRYLPVYSHLPEDAAHVFPKALPSSFPKRCPGLFENSRAFPSHIRVLGKNLRLTRRK